MIKPDEWLRREDESCFAQRFERLKWLASNSPVAHVWTFPGGWLAKQLFEEARYCFVYGQFLASAIMGFAFAERTLAAMFYGSGRNDLEKAKSYVLFREAHEAGWINDHELEAFDKARHLRNKIVHFKKPLRKDSLEFRAVQEERDPYKIIEDDVRHIFSVVFRLLAQNSVG